MENPQQSSDYSAFGVQLSGRNFTKTSSKEYRHGFNGMEEDDEVKGDGNSYTTEFRQLDPRLGRWLTLDPVIHHMQSPYCTFDNNPIFIKDPKGADGETTDASSATGDPGKKILILRNKKAKAENRGNKSRVEKLQSKINELTTGNKGELYKKENPGGTDIPSNYNQGGGGSVDGDAATPGINCVIADDKVNNILTAGYRIATITPTVDGPVLQVFSIGMPDPTIPATSPPIWTANGLTTVGSLGGNITGISVNDPVLTDGTGNIINSSGGIVFPALPGTNIYDTYMSSSLDGVASDRIIRDYWCADGSDTKAPLYPCQNDITNFLLMPTVPSPIPYNCYE